MRIAFSLLTVFLFSTGISAAGNVKALLSFARFANPEKGPYLESYLNISAQNLERSKAENGTFHVEVLVEVSISKLGKEVYKDSYRVISPSVVDSAGFIPDFVDIQRIPLENGMHKVVLSLSAVGDEFALPSKIEANIEMKHQSTTYLSDLQIISGMIRNETPNMFTKVGYDLIPYSSDFFPEQMKELMFYLEFYPSKQDQKKKQQYVVDAYVVDSYTRMITGNLRKYFKRDAREVENVLHSFPISELPSGNYILITELKDKEGTVVDTKEFPFQRSNDRLTSANDGTEGEYSSGLNFTSNYGDKKKLETYIRCYYPIADAREESMIEKSLNYNDLEMMQSFMYGFWVKRNNQDPEAEWMKYKKKLDQVQVEYGSNQKHGCHTDRGRVYLQYGSPNSISKNYYEPSSYPYEIWHYYHVEGTEKVVSQQNVKFVFARIEQGLKNFNLLHSTGEGEMHNPRWKLELHQRSQIYRDIDQEDTFDYHGGKATERFNNPY